MAEQEPLCRTVADCREKMNAVHQDYNALWREVGSMHTTISEMSGTVDRLDSDFYNHGRDGFKTLLIKHMARSDERDDLRIKKEGLWRWIVGTILAVLTLGVLALGALQTLHNSKDITQQIHHIFLSESQSGRILAHSSPPQQDAGTERNSR